jgi:uncharacterized protein
VLRVLILLAAVYVLFALSIMLMQRRLIYFPTKLSSALAESLAGKKGLLPWRNRAGAVIGWLLPARGKAVGSVLVLHGNAGWAADRIDLARPLHEASLDVYILEYPGYGARPGAPSATSLLAAGEEALDFCPQSAPLFLVGESLGGGVATHLARVRGDRVSGMLLFAPYDRLMSVGARHMPFLPVSWLLWDRFNPELWLKDYRGPVGFVLAGEDQVIPPDLGRRLYESYGGPKRLQIMAHAGHNDLTSQSAEWWKEVFTFWTTGRQ